MVICKLVGSQFLLQSFCMMAHSTCTPSIVLVAALLITTLSYCYPENVHCVTPTATSCSSCPHNSTNCATLAEYAQEVKMYFTSNTTMVFLPGDHVLDRNITVANVTRLTMHGQSSSDNIATVVRNGSVGFSFTNMVNFNIYSLAFTSNNRSWSYGSHPATNSALFLQSTQSAKLVNCSFHDNLGTAITVRNTNVTLAENNEFISNKCGCKSFSEVRGLGCGVTALNSNLTFTGNTVFHKNNASFRYCAGAIWASRSLLHFNGTNIFTGNSAQYGGAIHALANTSISFSGTNDFTHNSAYSGTFNRTNNFINNLGNNGNGGAINARTNTVLTFTGTSYFNHNSAVYYGGAIYMKHKVVLTFNGSNNFFNNSAVKGGVIFAVMNTSLSFTGTSSFINNSAINGGAIFANVYSTLIFDGSIGFNNNGKHINGNSRGGAMYLAFCSTFSILLNTTTHLENNHASLGGAIYVYNHNPLIYCTQIATSIQRKKCFFQVSTVSLLSGIQIVFKNNSADIAGSVLYGGAIDKCTLDLKYDKSGKVFDMLFQYQADNTTSSISSDPFRVCPCENNHPECSKKKKEISVYPGETFQVLVVAVGARDGIVPAQVISHIDQSRLLSSQYVQQTTKMCTTLNYTVFSQQRTSQLSLYADGPCSTFGDKLIVQLNINQTCPPGFDINQEESACVCDQKLKRYTKRCNITNGLGRITRESDDTFWVGYNEFNELILHPHCPFDYCVNHTVVFPLNNTDMQCAYNRSGLLCGACNRYSLVLGSSHCKQCTMSGLSLLVPFALMGVALVFLLLILKLTVATGTLSGLVFYANIVGANRTMFLPVESTDALSVFIAWLNLDFGVETCFYDVMTAYGKTWLQFVFPVYLWLLVGLVIFVSHYSQRFTIMLGSNPVSVLATLILLSYAKILHTLIMAVSFINLQYQYNYNRKVWLHDPNVEYLVGKHIPLFLVAMLVFLFLFLPYTFLLLFGQWLPAISHLRLFSWVNRLKPFMDSYHAPYKPKHRYWPGLLLVLRCVLLLVFAFNHQQDPSINLITILVGTGFLQLWALASGGVYKNWYLDILEGSFVLNLIILVGNTYHVSHSEGDQLAVGYTSVSIALATFIGIFAYHIFQQLRQTKLWKKMPNLKFELKKLNMKEAQENFNDNFKIAEFDKLREPLLEDLLPPTHSVV